MVHCQSAGQGRQVLNYLARYIFRVAISNSRLERFENGQVTFRYRDNRSQQLRRVTLPARSSSAASCSTCCRAAVPRSVITVSVSPAARAQLEQARTLLDPPLLPSATRAPHADSHRHLQPSAPPASLSPLSPGPIVLIECCRRNGRCHHDHAIDPLPRYARCPVLRDPRLTLLRPLAPRALKLLF